MAIKHIIYNIDRYFKEVTTKKIILNDLRISSGEDREEIINNVRTIHDSELLKSVASCRCGALTGNFRLQTQETCIKCGQPVTLDRGEFEPTLWCRQLTSVPFLSPKLWMIINTTISINKDSLLWLSDPTFNDGRKPHNALLRMVGPKEKRKSRSMTNPSPALSKILNEPVIKRSYKWTLENLYGILEYLSHTLERKKREGIKTIMEIYKRDKNKLFSEYLPVMGKKIFIVEAKNTKLGKYSPKALSNSIDNTLRFMDNVHRHGNDFQLECVMAQTIASSAKLVEDYYKSSWAGKPGGSRKYINSTRVGFSGRTVGSSIAGFHDMEQIQLPWNVAMIMFRPYIINKLVNYGMSLKECRKTLVTYFDKYHPLLDKIFKDLIKESPYEKGIPIIVHRNPTLTQSSLLFLYVGEVKTNPKDATVGLSVLLMTYLSGDFDGDEYNFMLLLDNFIANGFEALSVARSVMDYNNPGEVAGIVTITKATATIMANFINKNNLEGIVKNEIFEI